MWSSHGSKNYLSGSVGGAIRGTLVANGSLLDVKWVFVGDQAALFPNVQIKLLSAFISPGETFTYSLGMMSRTEK